MNTQKNK